ncbi:MAG: C40 family peptidase [Clostridia bacterium]|nr:C40 family peptidase [Clostridia bacterium]
MKKIIAAVLTAILAILALAGCDNVTGDQSEAGTSKIDVSIVEKSEPADDSSAVQSEPEASAEGSDEEPSEPVSEDVPEDVSGEESAEEISSDGPLTPADEVVALANSLIGTPYVRGGTTPEGFDNSGFVYYCFKQIGVKIPRQLAKIATAGTELTREEMEPGDIAVFANEIGGPAGFVGIYIGNGRFIACSNPEKPTAVKNMDSEYWTPRFISGRRVLG